MKEPLRAAWEVNAGLVPGQPLDEYTKRFYYTGKDYEEDGFHAKEMNYQPLFMKQLACAHAYAQQLSNPRLLNWVQVSFIWY